MTYAYFTDRGLSSLRLILQSLPKRGAISVPDFLCDEVVDVLQEHFDNLWLYRVTGQFLPDWATVEPADVFYGVDYFGQECPASMVAEGTAIIRDAVWMRWPYRPLDANEYWFGSFRKWAWPERGSICLSRVSLNAEPITIDEAAEHVKPLIGSTGWINYARLEQRLTAYAGQLNPINPSVFPLIVPDRRRVAAYLETHGIKLPGMWQNSHGFDNTLYDTLLLVPCDGRFTLAEIDRRADLILQAIAETEPKAA